MKDDRTFDKVRIRLFSATLVKFLAAYISALLLVYNRIYIPALIIAILYIILTVVDILIILLLKFKKAQLKLNDLEVIYVYIVWFGLLYPAMPLKKMIQHIRQNEEG